MIKKVELLSMCLDPLLKSDFTDFYAQNVFCKKSEMFGWDFGKCKFLISRAEVIIQNILDFDSSFYF